MAAGTAAQISWPAGERVRLSSGTARASLAAGAFMAIYACWLFFRVGGDQGLRYLSEVVAQLPATAAVAACCFAAARTGGRERIGWAALAAGIAFWTAGDWIWNSYDLFFRAEAPLMGPADASYYLGYPFLIVGVALLVAPPRGSRLDVKSALDALLLLTVLSAISAKWLLIPIYTNTGLTVGDVLVPYGYPAVDMVLLATIVLIFYRAQRALTFPAVLLAAGAAFTAAADILYFYLATVPGYASFGNPVELAYMAGYCAFGVAAIARLDEQRVAPEARDVRLAERQRTIALALPYVLLVPLLALNANSLANNENDVILFTGVLIAVGLVVARQFLTLAENAQLYNQVVEHDEARRRLLDRVVSVQEEERWRIALELHDKPVQSMSSMALRLGAARRFLKQGQADRAAEILSQAEEKLGQETQGLRDLMGMLHPPVLDERGVEAAMRDYVEQFRKETRIEVRLEASLPARLGRSHETIVYRIVQEALTNVRKHAQAKSASLRLGAEDGQLRLEVADDGVGFEAVDVPELAAHGHFGLASMQQRAALAGGSCEWITAPGAGTRIVVSFPLDEATGTAEAACIPHQY